MYDHGNFFQRYRVSRLFRQISHSFLHTLSDSASPASNPGSAYQIAPIFFRNTCVIHPPPSSIDARPLDARSSLMTSRGCLRSRRNIRPRERMELDGQHFSPLTVYTKVLLHYRRSCLCMDALSRKADNECFDRRRCRLAGRCLLRFPTPPNIRRVQKDGKSPSEVWPPPCSSTSVGG